jgi:hypothetical protein
MKIAGGADLISRGKFAVRLAAYETAKEQSIRNERSAGASVPQRP